MGKQVSAKEFILALREPYFHEIKNLSSRINLNQLSSESTKSAIYLIGMESEKYAMALQTFKGKMPDEEGEFLLSQLITRMGLAYILRETGSEKTYDIVGRIYSAYSQIRKYFTDIQNQ